LQIRDQLFKSSTEGRVKWHRVFSQSKGLLAWIIYYFVAIGSVSFIIFSSSPSEIWEALFWSLIRLVPSHLETLVSSYSFFMVIRCWGFGWRTKFNFWMVLLSWLSAYYLIMIFRPFIVFCLFPGVRRGLLTPWRPFEYLIRFPEFLARAIRWSSMKKSFAVTAEVTWSL
jgi:hypothetical protein